MVNMRTALIYNGQTCTPGPHVAAATLGDAAALILTQG
jgi:hypothetical protein